MDLTSQDQAAIAALTRDIMDLVDNRTSTDGLRQSITGLLTRRIAEASRAYDAQQAAEETHSTDRTAKHHISDCAPGYCGRHPGQRRDTPLPGRMGTGLVNNDDTETLNFADESDYQDRP
jgi:hypothetical protein